ncbi:probable leucine-rich repeat receptor-like protein kinase At1g35710 [Cryptomeria japonica]|uniref:probable leucine-rich repeat receptor-like protein kinase At1g35710 n=1 Tax=Cryptomeria japonica TaxID=3369 RepID=UPI0027D9D329|nr:probable leucine-rich repeat receptor-like protein kinase At1g35710 [Cryptomeria japonica]
MAVASMKLIFISAVFIILFTNPCIGLFNCPTQESQALLSFKAALNISNGILRSWVNGTDCCSMWDGISCDILTKHVERVNLSAYHVEQGVQSGIISDSFCNLPFLKYLNLRNIGLTGTIPSCLGNLSSLQYLHFKNNSLRGTVPPVICQLTNLTFLDVSYNQLSGMVPPCLQNLSLLKLLGLSINKFHGSLQLTGLSSLEQLYARNFSLDKNITSSQIALPSSVKILWLSSITISDTLFYNLAELKFLVLSYCMLNISTTWIPLFQLAGLDLSSCRIGDQIPQWLFTQYSLQRLTLASDNIVGEIPSLLWENNPQLYLFNLSGNHLFGSLIVPTRSIHWLTLLDVSRNALTGPIPSAWPPYLQLLMVNDNSLTGNIPPSLCNLIYLEKLDLSDNKLNGSIPPCFANYKLIQVLNLGDNSFEGSMPHGLCSSSLIVRNNKLSGAFPPSIINCKTLQVLDIGHNKFTGDIPWPVGNLSAIQVLMMKDNSFRGSIPSEFVHLKQLQILDLSSNNISGFIPHTITSLQAMAVAKEEGHMLSTQLNPFHAIVKPKGLRSYSELGPFDTFITDVRSHDELDMTVKGLELHYPYILSTLTGIDLSNNQLNGVIPIDFGKLKGLKFLNLSMNNLSGVIPPSFGDMTQLESLDFSSNRFYGNIPAELQSLTSLECLNVSNNNLSGSIPQGGQMITFDNMSYSGNPYLEGCPLPKNCSWPKFAPHLPSTNGLQDGNEDYRKHIPWYEIGLGLSHVAGFSCVMLVLAVTKKWRKRYFNRVDKILKFWFPSIRNKRLWGLILPKHQAKVCPEES